MSQAIRTAFTRIFLFGAASALATVACSDSPPAEDGAIGTTSQAVTKCYQDDDCVPVRCRVGTVYNGTTCVPLTCPPGYEDVGGTCVSDCPTGEVRQGGVCVTPPPALTPIACPSSPSCPPGQYLTSALPPQCSFTPPATCQMGSPPSGDVYVVPPFTAPVATSVALGASTVYAIGIPAAAAAGDNRAAVFAWGNNEYGQLGDGTFTSSSLTSAPTIPLFVPGNPVVQVVAGDTDACGLLLDGSVYCWGEVVTEPGAVSYATQTQIAFPGVVTYGASGRNNVVAIAHGQHHACAQTAGGGVFCWGNNDRAQLGLSPQVYPYVDPGIIGANVATALPVAFPVAAGGPTFLSVLGIAAAGASTCALAEVEYPAAPGGVVASSSTSVYCWGDNEENSLGYQGTAGNALSYEVTPQLITMPSPAGGNLPFSRLVGGSNGSAEQGGSFCAEVLGSVYPPAGWYCWGGNDFGQIDLAIPSPTTDFHAGVPSPQAVLDPSAVTASTIAISGDHGCVGVGSQTAAPLVYCFGDNDEGQLGFAASSAQAVNVDVQPQLSVITANGNGTPILAGIPGFSQFAVGYQFTCGIYTTPGSNPASYGTPNALGNVACWGLSQGELPTSSLPALLSW